MIGSSFKSWCMAGGTVWTSFGAAGGMCIEAYLSSVVIVGAGEGSVGRGGWCACV